MVTCDVGGVGGVRQEASVSGHYEDLQQGERDSCRQGRLRGSHSEIRKQVFVEKVVASLTSIVRAHDYPQASEDDPLSSEEESMYEGEGLLIDNLHAEGGDKSLDSEEESLEGVGT